MPVSRALIDDPRLQFDTRAVANWLLAKPDAWQIRLVSLPYQLQQRAGPGERMGRDRVRRILRELELAGYLIRARSKTHDGRWTWHIELDDEPPAPPSGHTTIDGSAVDGSPVDGSAVDSSDVHLHDTLNQTILDKVTPTTTTDEIAASITTGTSPVPEIRYPLILQGAALPSARAMIETCPPDQRQSVLDEIDAMQALGNALRPLGLVKSLASKAAMGQFFLNHSLPNAPGSAAKQRRDCVTSDSLISTHAAPRPLAPVSAQGCLARFWGYRRSKTPAVPHTYPHGSRPVNGRRRTSYDANSQSRSP